MRIFVVPKPGDTFTDGKQIVIWGKDKKWHYVGLGSKAKFKTSDEHIFKIILSMAV